MERFDLRSSTNNRTVTPERPVAPRPAEPAIDTPSRVGQPNRKEPFFKRKLPLIGILIAAVLLAGAAFYFFKMSPGGLIDSGYQAVFLTNGQAYFGKLQNSNGDYIKMTNVYYIQNKTATGADVNDVELVQLTKSLHGPKDELYINRDQVLFFENLKDDGQAAKLISGDTKK